jgi:hypothetical protein
MNSLVRAVVWRNLQFPGSEHFELWHRDAGWVLKGIVIAALDQHRPMSAEYEIDCDEHWRTLRVDVARRIGNDVRSVTLSADHGLWRTSDNDIPALNGCIDVDLGASPCTNTLPIRRFELAIGASAQVTAAWIRFPDLTIQPLAQTYTRVAPDRYRYESATGFSAEISVDDGGLVTLYPGGWERVAAV